LTNLVGSSTSFVTLSTTTYAISPIVSLADARSVTLYVAYNAAASDGQLSLIPLISGSDTTPGATDSSWFALGVTTGAFASTAALTRSLPPGMSLTTAPQWGADQLPRLGHPSSRSDWSWTAYQACVALRRERCEIHGVPVRRGFRERRKHLAVLCSPHLTTP
jgi:hypothetical protein